MNMSTPMSPKPLVNATCKLGKQGCFEDGRCHALGNCEHKIVTNADRIRAMSDEELAEWLNSFGGDFYCPTKKECLEMVDNDVAVPEEHCLNCVMDWLQQPAKEETT